MGIEQLPPCQGKELTPEVSAKHCFRAFGSARVVCDWRSSHRGEDRGLTFPEVTSGAGEGSYSAF